jgi:hypothetical protein
MVRQLNSKFSEAFTKFNNSSTGCDVARLSSSTMSPAAKGKAQLSFNGSDSEGLKSSLAKKMLFQHDEAAGPIATASSSSNHDTSDSPFGNSWHARSSHADSFFMEHLEGENDEEYVRGQPWSIEDRFNNSGRPNDYVGGYSPDWIRQYRRQKERLAEQQQH